MRPPGGMRAGRPRPLPNRLLVQETRDGGITWRTSWEVTNEQRRALARHYDYLGDLVRSCRRWRWPVGGDQDTRNRPD